MRDLEYLKLTDRVKVTCAECSVEVDRTKRRVLAGRQKHGKDMCIRCAAIASLSQKPQCSKGFWADPAKREALSLALKSSEAHKAGRRAVDLSGSRNGMFGRTHSVETKSKMSKVRIGKTGTNATAWKGGKTSLNHRVKGALQKRFRWFSRVFERDGNQCMRCGQPGKDAHHIEPLSKIIKRLLSDHSFIDDTDRLEWLIMQPEIVDPDLLNGECLCRPCHKIAHDRWGSHNASTRHNDLGGTDKYEKSMEIASNASTKP